jgi:ethanolamine utilization protein EutP
MEKNKEAAEDKEIRFMLVGKSTAGKTTLCQKINNEELKYYKTQTVHIINKNMIDTPGEYFERPRLRGTLTVTAVDADIILFVQDATDRETMFPPQFKSMFSKPCIGVVTKADLADEKQIEQAKKYLKAAGAGDIYVTSAYTGEGVEKLVKDLHIL